MSYLLASRRRQTRWPRDWSSDVCSTDLVKVISTPTITPIEPTAVTDWEPVEPTEGWRETSASGEATAAIDSWATALKIGRASCRERGIGMWGAGAVADE